MLTQGALTSTALVALPGGRDVTFDAASNSTYQTAQSTYSWSHTCSGTNRYLTVGISMLSVGGSSVSSITYNGVALTLIRAKASAVGAVRSEIWGLASPATGSNTIAVTLSTALDSIGSAVSFFNVNQTTPTESAADATATNVGAADATVDVITSTDRCMVVDNVATSDTAITVGAGQTSRNNTTGTLGSGAMSTEGIKSPAGTVTMSWTAVGAAATWTTVAVALRPASAASPAVAISGIAFAIIPDNLPRKPLYQEQPVPLFVYPKAVGIAPIRNWYTADDLPRKPLYSEQPPSFFFVIAKRFDGIPSFQPPDPRQIKPRYDEQSPVFFFIQARRFEGIPAHQPPDHKQVKPRYDEQPQPFFLIPIRRFQGVPSFQPPDPLPRKPRYDEQIVRGWQLPIIRPSHGWDFQPDILPRPLKIVDYRPMFFRIRNPQTFTTINI